MKKLYFLLFTVLTLSVVSCTKDYVEPVFMPAANTWVVNTDTIGPANFKYYDSANVLYGGIIGKASVTIRFANKPKSDGKFVFREKADEIDEISILVIDSVKNIKWLSTDDDGRPMKAQQYADIVMNGNSVGVTFSEKFLKRTDNVDFAKISLNVQ